MSNIIKSFECLQGGDEKEQCKKIEKFINTAIDVAYKTEKFLYWKFEKSVYNLYYIDYLDLTNVKKELGWAHDKLIKKEANTVFIEDKDFKFNFDKMLKKRVYKIRDIVSQPKLDRFLTIYSSLADTLAEFNNKKEEYCPWCNPNITLWHTSKQRKKDVCDDINKFILENAKKYKYKSRKINSKSLNELITGIKADNLNETIRLRGEALLEIMLDIKEQNNERLRNVTDNFASEYFRIENAIKSQYRIQ